MGRRGRRRWNMPGSIRERRCGRRHASTICPLHWPERRGNGSFRENWVKIRSKQCFRRILLLTGGLSLLGHRGTKILASGAVLLIDGFMEPVSLRDSEDILLEGLTIDHVRRPFSRGEVVAATGGRDCRAFRTGVSGDGLHAHAPPVPV